MRFLTLAIIDAEKETIELIDSVIKEEKECLWFTDSPLILDVFEKSLEKLLKRLESEEEFDAYEVSNVTTVKQLLKHFEEMDPYPYKVITPDLDLIVQPFDKNEANDEKLFLDYLEKIRNLLSSCQENGVAIFITCHN